MMKEERRIRVQTVVFQSICMKEAQQVYNIMKSYSVNGKIYHISGEQGKGRIF